MTLGSKHANVSDLPSSIDIEFGIWGKIYDNEPERLYLFAFEQTKGMEAHGFFFIQSGKFTERINWEEMPDVTSMQVAALREELTRIRAKAEAEATAIQGQINRLLSITLETKDDHGIR